MSCITLGMLSPTKNSVMCLLDKTAHPCGFVNTLRPWQNGRHFADDIFKCIFLNENVWIPIKISIKSVPKRPIDNIPALVQIMAGRRPGDKSLSESMMVSLTTHICVTRPQWVKEVGITPPKPSTIDTRFDIDYTSIWHFPVMDFDWTSIRRFRDVDPSAYALWGPFDGIE